MRRSSTVTNAIGSIALLAIINGLGTLALDHAWAGGFCDQGCTSDLDFCYRWHIWCISTTIEETNISGYIFKSDVDVSGFCHPNTSDLIGEGDLYRAFWLNDCTPFCNSDLSDGTSNQITLGGSDVWVIYICEGENE